MQYRSTLPTGQVVKCRMTNPGIVRECTRTSISAALRYVKFTGDEAYWLAFGDEGRNDNGNGLLRMELTRNCPAEETDLPPTREGTAKKNVLAIMFKFFGMD